MNKKTKKIIAREFLFILGTAILFLLVVFASYLNTEKQTKLETEIKNLTQSEKLPYRLYIYYYINDNILKGTGKKISNPERFISILNKDSLRSSLIYDDIKSKGSIDISKENFLKRISDDNESEKYYLSVLHPLENKLSRIKNSFLNEVDNIIVYGYSLLLIFFAIRYLIYMLFWSIKQLKE
ncbi:hypothetical protein [Saccharicrinis aurantiacus]|uniref:hypothetical protein n=1 Tax=Saccharicrinis aurantiacus TaxID=1849719 RepID=UPI002493A126|nr:hypothetical protein [Saccharicrinis aurantiacus]